MSGLRRFSVRKTGVFSWALPTKRIPSLPWKWARYSAATSSLRWPLAKVISGICSCSTKRSTAAMKALLIGCHEGRGGEGLTAVEAEEGGDAAFGLQSGLIDVEVHAVDAFDFQRHVLAEDIGDGPW